ncbi:Tuberculostearic acid methyltransferase UfaA1 [Grifola frondosa]|uniref:Tuberculostearic acid methyltransferase UfaA1 n=1 Tax=Grifola frondosa TaxID=5627 RepID=A0A1C7M4V6_GRIFR|nr:Tuberculostearic acid methyltransferase UfaA1 [Grifola frondosa]
MRSDEKSLDHGHSLATSSSPLIPLQKRSSGSLTWLASYARSSILYFLRRAISIGYLEIEDAQGIHEYGRYMKGHNMVRLKVSDETFWSRVFLSGDLGFSEAYMLGEVEVNDLKATMNLWLDNESSITGLSSTLGRISAIISGFSNAFLGQTHSRARLNVIASYDQSNELFKAFLSQEMMYSCALWGEEEGGILGDLEEGPTTHDLEDAQIRKIHHVLRKARVKRGHRILEFGTGWGGLAIEAARTYDCEIDTLTLSKEQKTLAEERIKAAGLENRVHVHLLDYRDIPPEFEHAFDAFISIEMIEHVGAQHYNTYFKLVDFALKPRNATAVISSSTFPEPRYTSYQAEDFMRRYMWPNSCLPSPTVLIDAAHAASQGRFALEGVENHASHYPRTLRTWARRLDANLRQDLIADVYPSLGDDAEFAIFKRKWAYFFAYAGAGFEKGYIACHMLTFTRMNGVL